MSAKPGDITPRARLHPMRRGQLESRAPDIKYRALRQQPDQHPLATQDSIRGELPDNIERSAYNFPVAYWKEKSWNKNC